MTERDWIILAAGLLGGGAMGAIITAIATKYRNRRQPVIYRKEIIDIFKKNPDFPSLEASLNIESQTSPNTRYGLQIDQLSLARITLINEGNQDIEEFKFGITMEGTNEIVDLKLNTPDRLHIAEPSKRFDLRNPQKEVDITLKPFNRGDEYTVNAYFTYQNSLGPIKLSTAHSIKLVQGNPPIEISSNSPLFMLIEILAAKLRR